MARLVACGRTVAAMHRRIGAPVPRRAHRPPGRRAGDARREPAGVPVERADRRDRAAEPSEPDPEPDRRRAEPSPEPSPAATADAERRAEPSTPHRREPDARHPQPTTDPPRPSSPPPRRPPTAARRHRPLHRHAHRAARTRPPSSTSVRKRDGRQGRPLLQPRVPRLHGQARQEAAAAPCSPTRTSRRRPRRGHPADAQTIPTGVSRVGGRRQHARRHRRLDQPVDADVAIVDTGVTARTRTSTSPAATTARPRDRTRWRDQNGHGTHVAARSPPSTTASASSASPRAPACGRVRILNDSGYGLLSWYVCGLDWILAQRDPNDSSRPLIEAVNMSVDQGRRRRPRTAASTNNDVAPPGDLPPVPPAGSRSSPRPPTTATARRATSRPLQRGHHRLGPRRHGRQARRARWQSLLLVGQLRPGRHVRRLQQLRLRRRHHRPRQMHLVDDARARLRLLSGTSMAAPTVDRRGRALQGEPPEGDAGRGPRVAPLPRQPELEDLHRPGSDPRAAARRVEDRAARDVRPEPGPIRRVTVRRAASRSTSRSRSPAARPSSSGSGCRSRRCRSGWTASWPDRACSAGPRRARPSRSSSRRARPPAPTTSASGHEPGPDRDAQHRRSASSWTSRRPSHRSPRWSPARRWAGPRSRSACHGRRPRIRPARSRATRSSAARTAAPGPPRSRCRSARRGPSYTARRSTRPTGSASGPWTRRQLEPVGRGAGTSRIHPYDDRSSSVDAARQLAPVVERGRVRIDAERIGQARRDGRPELHRPRVAWSTPTNAAPRQGQRLHRRRVRPHDQPQVGELGQPPGRSARGISRAADAHDRAEGRRAPGSTRSSGLMGSSFRDSRLQGRRLARVRYRDRPTPRAG